VPGVVLDGGERIVGSQKILQRLDELIADPPLYPADPALRAEVIQAGRWGEEVLQPIARRITWATLKRAPKAMMSYAEGADLPIPHRLAALGAGAVAAAEIRIHGASDPDVRADLLNLPHHLDRIDAWIGASVLGASPPNAADLQIGAGVRGLLALGDLDLLMDARPGAELARRLYPHFPGHVPKGTLPASWFDPKSTAVGARLVPDVTL
jgi:glutathione S-transferase